MRAVRESKRNAITGFDAELAEPGGRDPCTLIELAEAHERLALLQRGAAGVRPGRQDGDLCEIHADSAGRMTGTGRAISHYYQAT